MDPSEYKSTCSGKICKNCILSGLSILQTEARVETIQRYLPSPQAAGPYLDHIMELVEDEEADK